MEPSFGKIPTTSARRLTSLQAATQQALQERRPEGLRLRWPDMQADDLVLAIGVHRYSDYGRHRDGEARSGEPRPRAA